MSTTDTIDGREQDALGSDGIAVALAVDSRLTDADLRVAPPTVAPPAPWRTSGARVALPGGAPTGRAGEPAAGGPGPDGSGSTVATPDPLAPAALDALLSARTSVRFFSDRPVDGEALTSVLRRVLDEDADAFAGEAAGGSALELLVAPLRVDGVAPALYALVDGGLDRVADLPVAMHEDLVLQREFAGAAALVFVMGSLRAAEDRHGTHGHRLGLVRAGCAAHAGWLHAMRVGLAGTVFAGALPTALRSLAAVDGAERTQLFALAIGHSALVPEG